MTTLQQLGQSLEPDALISLFTLDASALGGGVLRFCSTSETNGQPVKFGGVEFFPVNLSTEGFLWSGEGTIPKPKITCAMGDGGEFSETLMQIVTENLGGQGAILTRLRTYEQFLDGHSEGGEGIAMPPDIYIVSRVVGLNRKMAQIELVAPMDLPSCELPARSAMRDVCDLKYRQWNAATGEFIYSEGTCVCPYAGERYFDRNGMEVFDPAADVCGHRYRDCESRYGQGSDIPFGGFPGLARTRT